jgi:hypothetical protein
VATAVVRQTPTASWRAAEAQAAAAAAAAAVAKHPPRPADRNRRPMREPGTAGQARPIDPGRVAARWAPAEERPSRGGHRSRPPWAAAAWSSPAPPPVGWVRVAPPRAQADRDRRPRRECRSPSTSPRAGTLGHAIVTGQSPRGNGQSRTDSLWTSIWSTIRARGWVAQRQSRRLITARSTVRFCPQPPVLILPFGRQLGRVFCLTRRPASGMHPQRRGARTDRMRPRGLASEGRPGTRRYTRQTAGPLRPRTFRRRSV